MSPLLEVTEDTPPDMLAGSMDLRLVIPDGRRVRMSVDRRTPMMDLLVQVTTAYKISPAGYVLQPYGETGLLPYKPSTPIGALDTWIVHIVPKNQSLQNPSNKINLKQIIPPFEQTLRFQVNLPRNQLYVTRVSGRCSMRDILHQACSEKNLDPSKYTLRHPKQLDKPLCDELSIAEYGHNQVTMLSIKNLPTAVLTEDILQMNKYKAQSDSGSGSAASSVSPVVPVQPSKPLRKRRPAPKPPVQQRKEQSQKQQSEKSETIICHSRTSSDSSGYHEASVLSESPDSNNSSLPDSLPRRSKLPTAETNTSRETNKLSRSLSNLHQASTSASAKSSLKPAQSVSCLAPSRKKKPAPAPPVPIAEEKEDKSATLPPCSRLMESTDERIETLVNQKPAPVRAPSPVNTVVPATRQRISKPKAPVPRPRSTAFENSRPNQNIFDKLEVIISEKIAPQPPQSENTDSDNARLDAEIERMFDQATREHVSLESGVELSRGPSPDWNWEYRLPAPPTFRDDVTVPSLSDLNLSPPLKQILFEPLVTAKELINEESESETDGLNVELNLRELETINENELVEDVPAEADVVHKNPNDVNTINETNNKKLADKKKHIVCNGEVNGDIHLKNNKQNQIHVTEKIEISSKTSLSDNVNTKCSSDSNENIIQITPKIREESLETKVVDTKPKIVIVNKKNNFEEPIQNVIHSQTNLKSEKVCISIKNEEPQKLSKAITKTRVDRSDAIIRVNGKVERSQEQSAIISELTTVISERQQKPAKEAKPEPKQDRPHSLPLENFKITTYTSSKPVEIYKEGRTPQKPAVKESNLVVRRNSFTEEKKGSPSVKRSASAITNLQRRLELSRSNGNLLEVEETPVRHFQRNLRKTTSELSINIDTDEQKGVVRKQETGLQSLQVLRSILPQLSQSQGALNTIDQNNEKKEEKPAVHLTTWGERPKRQVSIKTDKDYVVGGNKSETTVMYNTSTTTITPPTSTSKSVTVEVVSPVTRLPVTPESTSDRTINRSPRTSVYKSMETGNTKAIKLPDLGRIPVVRGVELKKHPTTSEKPPLENGFLLNGHSDKPFSQSPPWLAESRQLRPPSYLFGCEPKVYSPPPAPTPPPMFKLKPASQRELPKQSLVSDPREELLSSIRNFGKSSLRKVSTR